MSIVVTGATGHLGGLAVDALLDRGVAAGDIVGAGRNRERLAALAARGVSVAPIELDDLDSLRTAFEGAEVLLFVSGSEVGERVRQHRNAIMAACDTGIGFVAYTSIAHADTSQLLLAAEHRATETALEASGLRYALLRNSWYVENYTSQIPVYLERGRIVGAAGDGRVSAATRADYAAAAAEVVTSFDREEAGHERATYELGGDEAFTMTDLAAEVSRQTGRAIPYEDLTVDAYRDFLVSTGLPEVAAASYADNDRGVADGELYVDTGDLHRLLGRPPTTLREAVDAALS